MTTLTISIIVVFVLGYALIATESLTKVNKAAIALLMLVGCWTLYMMDPMQYLQLMHPDYTGGAAGMVEKVTGIIQEHLGDTATTLFFLMGAMTIVEIVDQNGGFNWVRKVMKTKSKRALLWRIAILTFFLSAILDNLTTSIVMIMILRKLVTDHKDRMVYASLVIIAANSGGAFSPIGDVTTIMLWNKGLITAAGVIAEIFIPSVVSMVIPALILQTMLKGALVMPEVSDQQNASVSDFTEGQRKAVFWLGVGGLIFVPIFKSITHLPPFVGILLDLEHIRQLQDLLLLREALAGRLAHHDILCDRHVKSSQPFCSCLMTRLVALFISFLFCLRMRSCDAIITTDSGENCEWPYAGIMDLHSISFCLECQFIRPIFVNYFLLTTGASKRMRRFFAVHINIKMQQTRCVHASSR